MLTRIARTPVARDGAAVPGKRRQNRGRRAVFLRNTASSLAQQVAAMAFALMLVPIMLWHLGPERYGLWLMLQVFGIVGIAGFAELGLQGALVRMLARFHAEDDQAAFRAAFASGLALIFSVGCAASLAILVFAQIVFTQVLPIPESDGEEMRRALSILALGLFAAFPSLAVKAFFAARQELAVTKAWEFLDRLFFTAAMVILLQVTDDLALLILAEQVIAAGLMIGFACVARRRGGREWLTLRPAFRSSAYRSDLIRLARPVFAAHFISQGFNRIPELFVASILGPLALTAYQLAARLPRVLKTLMGSLNAAVLGHIAATRANDDSDGGGARARFALEGLRINLTIAVPLLVALSLFAPVLLELWVGAQYRSLAGLLALNAAFQGLFLTSNYCAATLVERAQFRLFVRLNFAAFAAFVLALILWLEEQGLFLLFIAQLSAGLVLFSSVILVFSRAHAVKPRLLLKTAVLKPVLLSAGLGVVLLGPAARFLSEGDWLLGGGALAVGGLSYVGLIPRFVLGPADRRFLFELLSQVRSLRELPPG